MEIASSSRFILLEQYETEIPRNDHGSFGR